MQEHIHSAEVQIRPVALDSSWFALRPHHLKKRFQDLQTPGVRKVDLRPDGLKLVIRFPPWRFRDTSRVILQIIEAGKLSADLIVQLLSKVVEIDPLDLAVYRVDFTIDVIGYSLDEWRRSVSIARKRSSNQFADFSGSHQKRRYETLTFGSRDRDQLKLYDKEKQLRKIDKVRCSLPSPWTRIERTYTKQGVPKELATLGLLLINGQSYDPFSVIVVHPALKVTHEKLFSVDGYTLNQCQNAAWTLHLIEEYGRTEAKKRITAAKRDANRYFAS